MVFIGQINHHTKSWEIKGYHLKMKFVSSNKQVWPLQPLSLLFKKKKKTHNTRTTISYPISNEMQASISYQHRLK